MTKHYITPEEHARLQRRRGRQALGLLITILVLVGFVTVLRAGVGLVANLFDDTAQKQEYEDKLEGLVLFDPMPFDGIENIDDLTLREAAVWGCIYNIQETQGGFDNYNTDPDTEQLLLPSVEVDAYLARLVGPSFKLTHRSFEMEDMTIEFDESSQCYKIPVTGTVGYYRAVVTRLFKRSGQLHVTVGYIPTSSTDDSIINQSSDTPTKYMDYLFERQSGSWYLTGLTESETKPESAASSAAAQPEPTPRTSAAVRKDAVQTLLDGMTTHEKICQLLIVHPEVLTDGGTVTAMTDSLAAALRDYPVGGFLLSAGNMTSGEQLAALTAALSSASATAPLVTVDEEGGRVARLMNTVGTTKLNSMYSYRSLGTQGAYDNAQTLAHDIAAYGFNTDFAPVADVWTNKKSNAIGDRAYSDDYDEAAALVATAVSGFRDAGVICCLKHFPGHGSTATDSHNGAATVDKTLPQLRQEDLKPFVSGIAAGADMVMVGHLTVPTMDDVPASLSHKLVTNLLRYDLGFRGVIVTDGLQMQALAQYTDGEKAVLALSAGNDMLLEISDVPGAVAAVEQALADGTLTQAALDASVLRVLQLKLAHGIVPLPETG